MKYKVEFDKNDFNVLHDIILNALNKNLNNEKIIEYWDNIPEDIKLDVLRWGLNDTLIKDKIYDWLISNKKYDFSSLLALDKPSYHDCIIAVTKNDSYIIIPNDLEEVFDGDNLEDNLTNMKNIPKEPGLYKTKIKYFSYKCNIPIEPVEYDLDITIESIEKIEIDCILK